MENNTKKLSFKHYLIIGSMLFGMFFGAGNLIFPIHLGQLASAHWMSAGIGFLLTGTLLPLLAIIAIAVTHSNGIYDLAKPIAAAMRLSSWYWFVRPLDPYLRHPGRRQPHFKLPLPAI